MLTAAVLASSLSLEYPITTDALPNINHTRRRLLARIFEFRQKTDKTVEPTDDDYELLYAYSKCSLCFKYVVVLVRCA